MELVLLCCVVWGTGNKDNVVVLRGPDVCIFAAIFFYVPRHRNVEGSRTIIPIEFDATIKIARPILGEFIFCFDAFDAMICMLFSNIFHAKFINN
jgi:hypothetical protein